MNNNLSKYFNIDFLKSLDDYTRAFVIVGALFTDKVDKAGEPYLYHLLYVSDHVETEAEKIVGLLHDLVEDTDITFEDLLDVGFSDEVVDALRIITKMEGESYPDFITRIIESNNIIAIRVKKVDMENNMDPKRLSKVDEETRVRLQNKYESQYQRICDKLEELKGKGSR